MGERERKKVKRRVEEWKEKKCVINEKGDERNVKKGMNVDVRRWKDE